jgi:transcriptional regulator with XRE-family HTH domain
MQGILRHILQFLKQAGLSQDEIARLLGVKKGTLSKWINGRQSIPEVLAGDLFELLALVITAICRGHDRGVALRDWQPTVQFSLGGAAHPIVPAELKMEDAKALISTTEPVLRLGQDALHGLLTVALEHLAPEGQVAEYSMEQLVSLRRTSLLIGKIAEVLLVARAMGMATTIAREVINGGNEADRGAAPAGGDREARPDGAEDVPNPSGSAAAARVHGRGKRRS